MNKLKNLKLKSKFLIFFGTVLFLVLILATVGLFTLDYSNKFYYRTVSFNVNIIKENLFLTKNLSDMRRDLTAVAYSKEINDNIKKDIDHYFANIRKSIDNSIEYLNPIKDKMEIIDEIFVLLNDLDISLTDYNNKYIELLKTIEQQDDVKRIETVGNMSNISRKFNNTTYIIQDRILEMLDITLQTIKSKINSLILFLALISAFIIIFCAMFSIIISKLIIRPIEKLKDIALRVSDGDLDVDSRSNVKDEIGQLSNAIYGMSETFNNIIVDIDNFSNELDNGNLSYKINVDKYKGTFKNTTISINNTIYNLIQDMSYILSQIKEFGNGNFNSKIKDFSGDKAVVKEEIIAVQNALKGVSTDISSLIKAANNGDLDFRLDTSGYIGQWKETTDGLNQFVDNVVIPIKETQNALNQFSIGNFSHRVTNRYKGEFNNIKNTINYTAETIDSYINEISNVLTKMANKNFDVSIDRDYLGDFKEIKSSLNLIINNLNNLTKDIISSAEQVSAGANQISESSISLAEGATEQSEAVERLNISINNISQKAIENAKNSEKANTIAINAKESASDGKVQMDKMLLSMQEIDIASSSISNIIKVIDDIAFQTNILALNAAVEAARAGEHGKGFAVVAEEVRNLAARSQQAAKETTELIESSVSKVEEGSKIAHNTADYLVSIVSQIEEISHLVDLSTVSSKEQEKSIKEIKEDVYQISNVTQTNTATSEEAAAASQELASQAEIFYSTVSDFKLKK